MRAPKYRLHKPTGKAVVTIRGKDFYLGMFGTPDSQSKYRQIISEYFTAGGTAETDPRSTVTVAEAFDRYRLICVTAIERREARWHFEKLIEVIAEHKGDRLIADFGPLMYEQVRDIFVSLGWSRQYVNRQAGRVKIILRWLVSRELYSGSKLADVREVPDLRRGRTVAPETTPVTRVDDETVLATLPFLPHPVRGLVLFQWWTGCRPSEAIKARREDINIEGVARLPKGKTIKLDGVWVYQPPEHKGSWSDKERYVLIGPQGQADLDEYLKARKPKEFLFPPTETRKASRGGDTYLTTSYARRVAIAAKAAGATHWFPYQLRHRFAAMIRDAFSESHAKEVLGHSHLEMTDHYCGIGLQKAAEAMRKVG